MLKHGDILVCKRNRLLSKLIRKFTKSVWSHTSLVIEVWGQPYIVEMQSKGVELISYEEWKEKQGYEYVVFRNPDNFDKKELGIKALSLVGRKTKYDYITFIIRIPYKLLTKKYHYKGEEIETKRMICSQLTAWVHKLPLWHKSIPATQYEYLLSNWTKIEN
jgi:hypothetical protein